MSEAPLAASTIEFAAAARRLAERCRARGLITPSFRSPPALATASRTIRRRADGSAIVAVRVRGRPLAAVVRDMVDGVAIVNGLTRAQRDELQAELDGDAVSPRAA